MESEPRRHGEPGDRTDRMRIDRKQLRDGFDLDYEGVFDQEVNRIPFCTWRRTSTAAPSPEDHHHYFNYYVSFLSNLRDLRVSVVRS
jgi:hypothetical protein